MSKWLNRKVKNLILFFVIAIFQLAQTATQIDAPPSFPEGMDDESGKNSVTTQLMNNGFVNLATGLPQYQVPLYRIYTKSHQFYFDLNMYYDGNVQYRRDMSNEYANVGSAGLGWHIGASYILVNHKGTRSMQDDEYYFVFSNGSMSKMIPENTNGCTDALGFNTNNCHGGLTYFTLETNPKWIIKGWFKPIVTEDSKAIGRPCDYMGGYSGDFTYGYYKFDISNRGDGCQYLYDFGIKIPVQSREMWGQPMAMEDNQAHLKGSLSEYPFANIALDEYGMNDSLVYMIPLIAVYAENKRDNIQDGIEIASFNWHKSVVKKTYQGYFPGSTDLTNFNYHYDRCLLFTGMNTDNNMYITFDYKDIGINEGYSYPEESKPNIPIPYKLYNDNYISTIHCSSGDKIDFTYASFVNPGIKGKEKRLLTNIKRLLCPETAYTILPDTSLCPIEYSFEYDNSSYCGMLKKIAIPNTGYSLCYDYKTETVDSKNFWVVKSTTLSGGFSANPNIKKNYSYSSQSGNYLIKGFDRVYVPYVANENISTNEWTIGPWPEISTGTNYLIVDQVNNPMIYWKNVSEGMSNGNIVYEFKITDDENKGAVVSKTVQNSKNNPVSSEKYSYYKGSSSIGNWMLYQIDQTNDNIKTVTGTSNTGLPLDRYNYTISPDNITKITWNLYPEAPGRMYWGDGGYKIYSLSNYTQTNTPFTVSPYLLPDENVIKAKYTTWSSININNRGYFPIPLSSYFWNSPTNRNTTPIYTFQAFNKDNPSANNWIWASTNTKFTQWGAICETKEKAPQGSDDLFIYNSTFYSGQTGLPIATIKNAQFDECAFIPGDHKYFDEYYDVGDAISSHSYYWLQGFWDISKIDAPEYLCEPQNWCAHFGEKAIHVKKTYGPVGTVPKINIDVDHVFSAWICALSANSMRMTVEVRKTSDKSKVCTFDDLVTGLTPGKWQNLKRIITVEMLKAKGITNGNDYYFSIWIGNYPTDPNQSEFVVEDIRFYPKTALVTTIYYSTENGWPKPIVELDANANPGPVTFYDEIGRPREIHKVLMNVNRVCREDVKVKEMAFKTQGSSIATRNLIGPSSAIPHITKPGENENYFIGQTMEIHWTDIIGRKVTIYYSHGGLSPTKIADIEYSYGLDGHSYLWSTPAIPDGLDYTIRIEDQNDPSIYDVSPSFGIGSSGFFSPKTNDDWVAGCAYNLAWALRGATTVDLYYSPDGGSNYNPTPFATVTMAANFGGTYQWTIPFNWEKSASARIKAVDHSSTDNHCESAVFTIERRSNFIRRFIMDLLGIR
jgi:hypothetical protein